MKLLDLKKFFSNFFKPRYVTMKVDKVFLDPSSNRYHVLLKSKDGKQDFTFLHSGFLLEENVIFSLFLKSFFLKRLFSALGIRLKYVKILKKINSSDSAYCVFEVSPFIRKKVYMSSIEALRIAYENNSDIKVKREVIGVNYYDLDSLGKLQLNGNSMFFAKMDKQGSYNSSEVVM